MYAKNHQGIHKTILDCLNLVTVAVPPALPLALTIGTSVALARLKHYGIFCSDSSRISAAGRVNCLCFDKTGTLTTDGLTLKGVHYVHEPPPSQPAGSGSGSSGGSSSGSSHLGSLVTDVSDIYSSALVEVTAAKDISLVGEEDHKLMLSYVMSACHSISILDQEDDATALVLRLNSEIIPDPSVPEQRASEVAAFLLEDRPGSNVEELLLGGGNYEETILVKVEDDLSEAGEVGLLQILLRSELDKIKLVSLSRSLLLLLPSLPLLLRPPPSS